MCAVHTDFSWLVRHGRAMRKETKIYSTFLCKEKRRKIVLRIDSPTVRLFIRSLDRLGLGILTYVFIDDDDRLTCIGKP